MSYKYNLGNHYRKISTPNPKAGKWFNRGLIWMYAFDLEMAGRCFGLWEVSRNGTCAILATRLLRENPSLGKAELWREIQRTVRREVGEEPAGSDQGGPKLTFQLW